MISVEMESGFVRISFFIYMRTVVLAERHLYCS